MIRLVTQFDDDRTRPAAATPTCGVSFGCCCCCVVTTLTSSAITARNLRKAARSERERAGGGKSIHPAIAAAAGALLFPAMLLLFWKWPHFWDDGPAGFARFCAWVFLYFAMLFLLGKMVKQRFFITPVTWAATLFGFFAEGLVWFALRLVLQV